MSVQVIGTLKPKNGLDFPVVEAVDVSVEGYASLADAVTHFATDAMIDTIIATLTTKASASDLAITNAAVESKADKTTTNSLQSQINQIAQTAGTGSADTEVAQARVGADGTSYQTLKARLDAENSELKTELSDIGISLNLHPITEWKKNKYYPNNQIGATVDVNSPMTLEGYKCAIESVDGYKYCVISGRGANAARLYAFLDSEYKVIANALTPLELANAILYIPQNADYIAINTSIDVQSYLAKEKNCTSKEYLSSCSVGTNYSYHNGFLTENLTYTGGYPSCETDIIECQKGDHFVYTGKSGNLAVTYVLYKNMVKLKTVTLPINNTPTIIEVSEDANGIKFTSYSNTDKLPILDVVKLSAEMSATLQATAKVPQIENTVKLLGVNEYLTIEKNGYLTESGTYNDINDYHSYETEKIPTTKGEVFSYRGKSENLAVTGLFYNNDEIVGAIKYRTTSDTAIDIEVPENVNYVKFSSFDSVENDVILDVSKYGEITSTLKEHSETLEQFLVSDFAKSSHNGYLMANGTYNGTTQFHSITTDKIPVNENDVFHYRGKSGNLAVTCILYNNDSIVTAITKQTNAEGMVDIVIPASITDAVFSSYATIENDVIFELVKDGDYIKLIQSENISPLTGKKINVLGDSYVANHQQPVSNTWHYKIADKYNMTYRNYGINGNGMVSGNNPMSERYINMDDDADYVLIIGGTNDFNYQTEIEEFKSDLADFIENLTIKYPNSIIAFFTIWNSLEQLNPAYTSSKGIKLKEYNDAIVEECNKFSIPVFNSWNNSGIRAWDSTFRTNYFQSPTDHAHLNASGHDLFINKAATFLMSL